MQSALTKSQAAQIAKRFVVESLPNEGWYQRAKAYIKAIILYGSIAKGTNRPDSDIDLLVLMPLDIEERYTEGEYVYTFNGRDINIVIRSIERMRHISTERKDMFQKEVFRGAEIIQAVDGEVSALLQSIETIGDTV